MTRSSHDEPRCFSGIGFSVIKNQNWIYDLSIVELIVTVHILRFSSTSPFCLLILIFARVLHIDDSKNVFMALGFLSCFACCSFLRCHSSFHLFCVTANPVVVVVPCTIEQDRTYQSILSVSCSCDEFLSCSSMSFSSTALSVSILRPDHDHLPFCDKEYRVFKCEKSK